MQFTHIFSKLTIIFLTLFITACNLHKKNDKNNTEFNKIDEKQLSSLELITKQTNNQLQKIQNNNTIYFDFDKYNIKDEYLTILDEHINFLHNNPAIKVTIEGHTDEIGTSEYNIALGERRANNVKLYLQSKGINDNQISIISYGKEKPAVLGNNVSAYAKNRRAVLIY